MKYSITFLLLTTTCTTAFCQNKTPKGAYPIPDSINAVAYYAEMKITETGRQINMIAGIAANEVAVGLAYNEGQKIIQFRYFLPLRVFR